MLLLLLPVDVTFVAFLCCWAAMTAQPVSPSDAWLQPCPHMCTCAIRDDVYTPWVDALETTWRRDAPTDSPGTWPRRREDEPNFWEKGHATLDCANSGLTSFPFNVTSQIESALLARNRLELSRLMTPLEALYNLSLLDISGNHIYSVEGWRPHLPLLNTLAIDSNVLDYLPNCSFCSMPALRVLSAADNHIEIMHDDALLALSELVLLDLSGNRIYELNPKWFTHTARLKHLNLFKNNIHTLRYGDLLHTGSLDELNLSDNQLSHLQEGWVTGAKDLRRLHLQNNHLHALPSQDLRVFTHLHLLDLSGNRFERFDQGALMSVNVSELRASRMPELLLVEADSFTNLPILTHLEMCDSPQLAYIDRNAFHHVPQLNSLMLHNCNLTTVELEIPSALPSLTHMSVHNNPLICDCTLAWLYRVLTYRPQNISFPDVDITCQGPEGLAGSELSSLPRGTLPWTCEPRVLPLFSGVMNTVLGDSVQADCRAVGRPRPQIEWLLPQHYPGTLTDGVSVLKSGSLGEPSGRLAISNAGSLLIDYIQATDRGQYTCLASNPRGRDQRTLHVHVKNALANVLILSVTSTSVTVTWRSTRYTHDYQLLYRQTGDNQTFEAINIRPYMRSFTASNLQPRTLYEFCLAIKHVGKSLTINCTAVATRDEGFEDVVISVRSTIVGGTLCCLAAILVIGCVSAHLVRRYNRRKRQQEQLYGDNLSQLFLASMDSMSDTTPITYENRAAEIFDDDDIDEIRCAAASASATTASGAGVGGRS